MEGQQNYYVRGAGSVVLPTRRVLAVALALIATALIVITLVVASVDLHHLGDRRALARNGFSVDVTITGCLANASGTGITEAGFVCHGRYQVGGQVYDQAITGSSRQFPTGATIRAVTSVARPTELYSVGSIRGELSYRSALVVPTILLGLVIITLTCEFVVIRRTPKRRRFSAGKSHIGATQSSVSLH